MNLKNTYFGFTDNFKPMLKAKVENTLNNMIRENGQVTTEKEWVYNKLSVGYRPSIEENYQYWKRNGELSKPKTLYKLENEEGSFFEINKTSHDYACHIVKNGFTDVEAAMKYITVEKERIEEENRIRAEQEAKERAEREEQKQREQQEREARKIERLAKIQETILSFTSEQLEKINELTDYVLSEHAEINKDNIIASEYPSIMAYYDVMKFLAQAKLYPETTIESIKAYRELIDPNSKNPNKGNEYYIRRYKLDNDIRNMFFGLTDNMPSQTIRDVLTGKITHDEAHNRMQKSEQRKAAQEERMVTFYRYINGQGFVEAKGERIEIHGITAYGMEYQGNYVLIEESSGCQLTKGKNKTEVKNNVVKIIEQRGIENVKNVIEQTVRKVGLSPLLQAV